MIVFNFLKSMYCGIKGDDLKDTSKLCCCNFSSAFILCDGTQALSYVRDRSSSIVVMDIWICASFLSINLIYLSLATIDDLVTIR